MLETDTLGDQQVNMVVFAIHLSEPGFKVGANLGKHRVPLFDSLVDKDMTAVFGDN